MKSGYLKSLAAVLAAGLSAAAFAQPQVISGPTNETPEGTLVPPVGSVVLFDQTANLTGAGVSSQNFTPANDAFDSFLADDFVVTDAEGWALTAILAEGIYFNGPGPVDSMNVSVHYDEAGSPGDAVCEYSEQPAASDNAGSIQVDFPSNCDLAVGTYWLLVQANLAFAVGGQWGWDTTTSGSGNEAHWQNPNGGFGICPTWSPVATVCGIGGATDTGFAIAGEIGAELEPLARFQVNKVFSDGNTAEVDVELSCDTGLPLSQPATISEGNGVNFVVGDFIAGELDCTVTETAGADGYTVTYFDGTNTTSDGCSFEEVGYGEQRTCVITNTLDDSVVEVTKEWIDDNEDFNAINIAEASWTCSNVAGGGSDSGGLDFYGNPGFDSFSVAPDWDLGTTCNVIEVMVPDGGVEVDDSDCLGIVLFPGDTGSCTIYNTRLYEGIPTLSQYGLALMALIMLGVGLVGFRRFV